ncbi:MAG: AAA family ATPase [Coleofasciculus sp. C1-SOL-03]|uniref:AAA family ATPase n=1 Tax=Coleofasciculus sp. C1-SOL-03 TaxID=3069522 RepID=UPI003303E485
MHIDKLHIQNFRCFQEIHFKFPSDNTAILIGINGSGKSSVLDCLAALLIQLRIQILGIEHMSFLEADSVREMLNENFTITIDDINKKAQTLNVYITIALDANQKISWNIQKNINQPIPLIYNNQIYDYINRLRPQLLQQSNGNLPLLAYYRTYRILLANKSIDINNLDNKNPDCNINQLNSYWGAFNQGIITFKDFLIWFRQEEDYENEIRLRQDNAYRNPNLEVIRKAIEVFLAEFPDSDFHNLRVVRSKSQRNLDFTRNPAPPSLTITKNNQDFKLEQLSDGEKMLLMLVTDLARRLAIANPGLGVNALEGKGIVLIDEIDLHLHPQWQRIVIPSLTRTFPNCQFIVTTHSPQVLSNVKRENVFILEDYQLVEVTPHTYGRDSNSILYELMGVKERPNQVQEKINACFALIDEDKIEEAKIKLQELAELLGENDPEVVRGQTLISFLTE